MKKLVICASQRRGNTLAVLKMFTQEPIFELISRSEWSEINERFRTADSIVIGVPLFIENVPAIFLEFLAQLPKNEKNALLSFVIHGGFPETAQGRCCEMFLQTIPLQFGCQYGGCFIHGDTFAASLIGGKAREQILLPFQTAGERFDFERGFLLDRYADLQPPEALSKKQIRFFTHGGMMLQNAFLQMFALRLGCRHLLSWKPIHIRDNRWT